MLYKQLPYYNKTFSTIWQLGDIHIHLLKRHDEYKTVFQNVYNILNTDVENSAVVVTGDIVHSKTEMSPELIRLTSGFFETLASIMPTFIILGNHDLNLSNKNRLDAISPIIHNLRNIHGSLHLFKESGIYNAGNIDFAVYSILDDKAAWPTAKECNQDNVKIVLFHGPVYNAKTNTGYIVRSKNVEISIFDDFDIAMLGDIHTQQVLQICTNMPKRPTIAYNGSLVQMNHGEEIDGHGLLKWNITERSCEFVPVKNEYGYATLIYGKDSVDVLKKYPEYLRLRILTSDIDSKEFKQYVTEVKSKKDIIELSITKNFSKTRITQTAETILNIRDVDYQNTLIRQHLNLTDETLYNDILELNNKTNEKLKDDVIPKNIFWKPIKLTFDNLFSYGEHNELNFENFSGLIGIFGGNAVGKSSALNVLCFALYGKTPTATRNHHFLNSRKDSCKVELLFEVNEKRYCIVRKGTKNKIGEIKFSTDFYRLDDNNLPISLNGEEPRITNNNIRQYVGSYEDFILTTFSVQNQNTLFIDRNQSERKDILSQFMGLTIFDRLYDIALEESKELSVILKTTHIDDLLIQQKEIKSNLKHIQEQLHMVNSEIESAEILAKNSEEQLHNMLRMFLPLDSDAEKLNYKIDVNDKNKLQKTYDIIKNNIQLMENEKIKCENELQNIQTELLSYINFNEQYQEFLSKKAECENLNHITSTVQKERTTNNTRISLLKQYKYDPKCSYCLQNMKDIIKELENCNKLEIELSVKYTATMTEYTNKNSTLNNNIPNLYDKKILLQKQEVDVSKNILTLSSRIDKEKKQLSLVECDIRKIENDILLYEKYHKTLEINAKLENDLLKLKKEESSIKIILQQYFDNKQKLTITESTQNTILEKIEADIALYTTHQKQHRTYELYLSSIGRDGIPYKLIEKILPIVEEKTNNILSHMAHFFVSLNTDGKNINGTVVCRDSNWALELSSGMEKFISGLAIRTALMEISNLPRSNFMIIDEGFSVLSSENLSHLNKLLLELKNKFDFIIIVSHLDAVRDMIDDRIEITVNDGGYSSVKS
jgi:DNA repair exonuclease SbcCD ATPase subunit